MSRSPLTQVWEDPRWNPTQWLCGEAGRTFPWSCGPATFKGLTPEQGSTFLGTLTLGIAGAVALTCVTGLGAWLPPEASSCPGNTPRWPSAQLVASGGPLLHGQASRVRPEGVTSPRAEAAHRRGSGPEERHLPIVRGLGVAGLVLDPTVLPAWLCCPPPPCWPLALVLLTMCALGQPCPGGLLGTGWLFRAAPFPDPGKASPSGPLSPGWLESEPQGCCLGRSEPSPPGVGRQGRGVRKGQVGSVLPRELAGLRHVGGGQGGDDLGPPQPPSGPDGAGPAPTLARLARQPNARCVGGDSVPRACAARGMAWPCCSPAVSPEKVTGTWPS